MSGDWRQAADPPEPARPGNRHAVLLLVLATSAVLLVVAAATGLWAIGAYGTTSATADVVADARQLRGALHAVAAGAAVFALLGLAVFAVLARESHEKWTRVIVGIALLALFGAAGFLTASGARTHLQAGKPRVVDRGDAALREAAGLSVPQATSKGPPADPTSFWLHLVITPIGLVAAAAVLLGPRRA